MCLAGVVALGNFRHRFFHVRCFRWNMDGCGATSDIAFLGALLPLALFVAERSITS